MAASRRQYRIRMARLGSSSPNRLATVMMAGPRVSATSTATTIPAASGTPSVWNQGSRVKVRQNVAPAIVMPEASTTWAVPRNMV